MKLTKDLEIIIFIDLGTSQIEGNISSDGTIIVSPQNTNIDLMGFSVDLTVSGDGLLETGNSGYMDLDYELDIPIMVLKMFLVQ